MADSWRRVHEAVLASVRVFGQGVVWLGLAHSCPADRHMVCAVPDQCSAGAPRFTGPPMTAAGHPERVPAAWPGTAAELWLYEQLLGLGGGRGREHGR